MRNRSKIAVLLSAALMMTGTLYGCNPKSTQPTTEVTAPMETTIPITESASESKSEEVPELPPKEIQVPRMSREEFPKIDGSTATLPLSTALYQLTTGASAQEAEAAITHTKTTNAYTRLIDGGEEPGLVLAYEPSEAVDQAMKDTGVNLIIKPIGKDALVFMANEGNPVKSLTEQQLVDIYRGVITNWSKVGGENKEIMAFQRPENSGSQTLMEKLVMKGVPMNETTPVQFIMGDMGELIEQVAAYENEKNALGYSVYYYARNMYAKPGLRFMQVNGVEPCNETIKNGTYPYVNDFYAVIREDEPKDSKARQLFDWLTEADGQALVEQVGYVGMNETENRLGELTPGNPETAGAELTFDQDERLLLDGQFAYGASGVMVLNDQMEITQVIRNAHLPDDIKMVRLDEPTIMIGLNSLCGIYDLRTGTWLVKPEYMRISEEEDGTYIGYQDTPEKMVRVRMSRTETGFEQREEDPNQLLSYRWDVRAEEQKAFITDLDGNPVNEVNFAAYGDFDYCYVQSSYYVANYKNDCFVLFDTDGTVLFQKEDLGETFLEQMRSLEPSEGQQDFISLDGMSDDGSWLCGRHERSGKRFVYGMEEKKVLTKLGDRIELRHSKGINTYIASNEGKTRVCGAGGQPIIASTGQTFSHILDRECYGYQEAGALVIEDVEAGIRYELPVSGMKAAVRICGDIFKIEADAGEGIYKGERLLIPGRGTWWWTRDDQYYVVTDDQSRNLLLDRDGTILYESKLNESIYYGNDKLLVVLRGSYLNVIDHKGRSALKLLRGSLGND